MRKQCRECRSVTNAEAPYCSACGREFDESSAPRHAANWKGCVVAVAFGLLAARIAYSLSA